MPATLSRSASARAVARRASIALAQTDFRAGLRRGWCARRRCGSRYAITRVTVDLRDPTRQDYSGTLECALCGHTWTRAPVPDLALRGGRQQSVLLTILAPPDPGEERRTYRTSRGALRVVGSDVRTITNATYRDLARELADWRDRATRKRASLGRAQDRALTALATDRIARDVEPTPDMRAAMERLAALQARIAALQEDTP